MAPCSPPHFYPKGLAQGERWRKRERERERERGGRFLAQSSEGRVVGVCGSCSCERWCRRRRRRRRRRRSAWLKLERHLVLLCTLESESLSLRGGECDKQRTDGRTGFDVCADVGRPPIWKVTISANRSFRLCLTSIKDESSSRSAVERRIDWF